MIAKGPGLGDTCLSAQFRLFPVCCVRATALDALQNGFVPYVVRDACGDRAAGLQGSNLFDLQAKYAEVIGEADAIALIPGRAV